MTKPTTPAQFRAFLPRVPDTAKSLGDMMNSDAMPFFGDDTMDGALASISVSATFHAPTSERPIRLTLTMSRPEPPEGDEAAPADAGAVN